MQMDYANPPLEAELASARDVDAIEAALRKVLMLAHSFEPVRGRALFTPGLDAQLVRIAERLELRASPPPKSNDNVCIVTTRLYHAGGHSRLTGDISQLLGAQRTTLAFTDAYDQLRYNRLIPNRLNEQGFANHAAVLLCARSLVEKIVELHAVLSAMRPTRIVLMTHNMDPVGVTAAWPFRDIVEFVHHGDYQPALGAGLPFSAHVDPTYTCHPYCRAHLPGARYVGMMASAAAAAVRAPARASDRPIRRIATSGTSNKFQGPGPHHWADFVIAAMTDPQVEMLHVGDRNDDDAAALSARLADAGIDPARYRYTGLVPSLIQTLVDERIDAFLGSYPTAGGKVYLDVMSAGLVPVVPAPTTCGPLMAFRSPLKTWIEITEPGQTAAALQQSLRMEPELNAAQAQAALAEEFALFERYVAQV